MVVWYGLCAPAGVPRVVITKINTDVAGALKTEELQQRMQHHGFEATSSTPEQFTAFIKSETAKWAKVIKDADIKPD